MSFPRTINPYVELEKFFLFCTEVGVSPLQLSNFYTMQAASKVDPRQTIPNEIGIPPGEVRELRARLIMEEAIEVCEALGFQLVHRDNSKALTLSSISFFPVKAPSLPEILDGCADLTYVAVGTISVCGVPDDTILSEVCAANQLKFPNGEALVDENGKFQKPEGWLHPDINTILQGYKEKFPNVHLGDLSKYYSEIMTKLDACQKAEAESGTVGGTEERTQSDS